MKLSETFIRRPIATILLTFGVALGGMVCFFLLPIAPLPTVDNPSIRVSASMPGASPETMATAVATPLERHLGQIADVVEMTSSSSVGSCSISLLFGLDRDIDGAARDVQAAINAARADLPSSLKSNPTYRKANQADAPIYIMTLTSKTLTPGQLYDSAATVLQQTLSQVDGVGQVTVGGSSLPAVRVELNPRALFKYGIGLEDVRAALASANANSPKGAVEDRDRHFQIYTNDQARHAEEYRQLVVAYRDAAAVRLNTLSMVVEPWVAGPDGVAAAELDRVQVQLPGQLVERGLHREGRLGQAVAAERPGRDRVGVDGAGVDPLVRAAVDGDRLLDRVEQHARPVVAVRAGVGRDVEGERGQRPVDGRADGPE